MREFRRHGKLDQNVLSESQLLPKGGDIGTDQNQHGDDDFASQDFDFDDFGDDDHHNIVTKKVEESEQVRQNNFEQLSTTNALSNILTNRAKTGFLK